MFEKAKRFAKKIATSKNAQMTCLMMVWGVTAMMAQTTA
ncbi:conjugal transfer protein TraE, partial [Bacteroides thetaiotaomicron]